MTEKDIEKLSIENQSNLECPTIFIKDHQLFFELLTNIINEQVSLYYDYKDVQNARKVAFHLLRKIWLRMGPEDFNDVELFLQKQLEFLKSREFDNPHNEMYIKDYNGNKITYEVEMSNPCCESTRRMSFKIYEENEWHNLPKIYYDICEENGEKVCYIGAVQNGEKRNRIKSIERKLYKINKGIPESKVHPNFTMAMSLFYEFLRNNNITHIKVPILQVLSYRYHEIISTKLKKEYEKTWAQEKIDYMNSLKDSNSLFYQEEYEELIDDYEWANTINKRYVDKEDFISEAKTEGLINLFTHMTYLDDTSQINTEPYINASYLDITLSPDIKQAKK